jgi:hypothetical protein
MEPDYELKGSRNDGPGGGHPDWDYSRFGSESKKGTGQYNGVGAWCPRGRAHPDTVLSGLERLK